MYRHTLCSLLVAENSAVIHAQIYQTSELINTRIVHLRTCTWCGCRSYSPSNCGGGEREEEEVH